MLADHGLVVGEVDPAWWWPPGASEVALAPGLDTEDVFCFGEPELWSVAEAVGARSVNAVDVFGTCRDLDELTAAFVGLCRRAADSGWLCACRANGRHEHPNRRGRRCSSACPSRDRHQCAAGHGGQLHAGVNA